jgi:predicted ATP-dependent Lon-type protease
MLPKPHIVVSYADMAQEHVGYIYQATNWHYTGATKERTDMLAGDGKHSRHNFGNSSMRQTRSSKHRYIFFVGSKTERKEMKKALRYKVEPYPKGESKRYDASAHIPIQGILFGT